MKRLSDLTVVFADAGILAIDKPSGLLSQPGKGPELQDSVLTRVRHAFPWAELIHRLDRDTSGLILLALNPEMHRRMSMAFAARTIQKHYLGLCRGPLAGIKGTIISPLARIDVNPPRYGTHPEGKIAITEWLHRGDEEPWARIQLIPITGRSHQLRVHLASIGHPLIGDPIYGAGTEGRLRLHAERLAFNHPASGDWVDLNAPCPF